MWLVVRVLTILGLTIFTIATDTRPQTAGASSSAKSHLSTAPVTIQIKLDKRRVVAGTPIRGTAVLTNHTSTPLAVQQCALDGWLAVGLGNKHVPYTGPVFSEVACPPSVVLAQGRNRFPVTVDTTYGSCLARGGHSTLSLPKCLARSSSPLPPLPAGTYFTKVITVGLPPHTDVSNSVVVTLR